MNEIYIGRQPIYDKKLKVFAYELLFRTAATNRAVITDGDKATSDVIVNTFMEIGLDNIVSHHLAFINLTRAFFVDPDSISLPKDRVVLELLEDIEVDDEVLSGIRELHHKGYTIALDDFIYRESLKPLMELAHIVKIDLRALSRSEVQEHIAELRNYPLSLLAEKIETQDDYEFCKSLQFDYYQGYFFAQPKVIQGQRLPSNRLAVLNLLSRLQDPDISARALENVIAQDVGFSYRILRYVNSAAFALRSKIESIHQAVVILGLRTIKNWVTLLAMSQIEDKPAELMVTAMVRAKMAELMARAEKREDTQSYFTVGLFSALDALMDKTMEEILTQLPLAHHIKAALLTHEGRHGKALECLLHYERGEWEIIDYAPLDMPRLSACYLAAVKWANEVCGDLIDA